MAEPRLFLKTHLLTLSESLGSLFNFTTMPTPFLRFVKAYGHSKLLQATEAVRFHCDLLNTRLLDFHRRTCFDRTRRLESALEISSYIIAVIHTSLRQYDDNPTAPLALSLPPSTFDASVTCHACTERSNSTSTSTCISRTST